MREIKVSKDEFVESFQDYDLFNQFVEENIQKPSYLNVIENAIQQLLEITHDYETRQKLIKILNEVQKIV